MNAYIFLNQEKDPAFQHTKEVILVLQNVGINCFVNAHYRHLIDIENVTFLSQASALSQCDIVITIGGDGTLLHVASLLFDTPKPLLGINLGRVGFLTMLELDELQELSKLKTGDYFAEKRYLVDAYINDVLVDTALNEVLVSFGNFGSAIGLELFCDELLVNQYRSDGLLIATPTGSTAYSLSAGGPILDATVDAMVVTPICAHSLYSPSMVFGADRKLSVRMLTGERMSEFLLTVDGRRNHKVIDTDYIRFELSEKYIELISFKKSQQFESIDKKLKWR